MSLTVKRVLRLMRKGAPGRHLDGGASGVRGLYLCVDSRTACSWALRYQIDGRAHWMGLGSARTFTLDEARKRAKDWRQKLADGIDPLHAKRSERASNLAAAAQTKTFKQCAEDLIRERANEWKNVRHGHEWQSTLKRFVYPLIGGYDVGAVDRVAVLRVLEQNVAASRGNPGGKLWHTRTVSANRIRNRIELVLNAAVARGHRPAGENPAAWDVLQHVPAKPSKVAPKVHHAALPYAEVPALLAALKRREGVSVQALEFLILTATRTSEVLAATWDEIDLASKVWTIPAARMKSGKEHRVPLSPPAMALLESLYTEDGNPYLFVGTTQPRLSTTAMVRVLAGVKPGITVHGFRSSFSDFAHERTAHSNHVIEMSLAHSVGNAVEQAYRRGDMFDKRRKLMDAWGEFVTTPSETSAATVTPIRAADVSS